MSSRSPSKKVLMLTSKESLSEASKACQQLVKHVSSSKAGKRALDVES